jgi:hypothetical protein
MKQFGRASPKGRVLFRVVLGERAVGNEENSRMSPHEQAKAGDEGLTKCFVPKAPSCSGVPGVVWRELSSA